MNDIDSFIECYKTFGDKNFTFSDWLRENITKIHINSYKIDEYVNDLVKNHEKINQIKIKECFRNSQLLTILDPNIEYVQGYIKTNGIIIEHAWNKYGDFHFDTTLEFNFNELAESYYQVFIANENDILNKPNITNTYKQYLEKIKN